MGDLQIHAWSGVVKNIVVEMLLGTSNVDRCMEEMFMPE